MSTTSAHVGDRITAGTARSGLRTVSALGIIRSVSSKFNPHRLDWDETIYVTPTRGDVISFLLHEATGLVIEPPPAGCVHSTKKGDQVVTVNPWTRDGVYRLADGRFARIAMDWNNPTADTTAEILSERPTLGAIL